MLQRTLAVHHVLQALFAELPLEHLLLDGARGEEAVQVALLLLTVSPAPRGGLLVVGGVPVGVEQDQAVATDEVDPAPASLGREKEDEAVLGRIVEALDELLPLADAGAAVQAAERVPVVPAERLDQIQSLRVVADDHHAVLRLLPEDRE